MLNTFKINLIACFLLSIFASSCSGVLPGKTAQSNSEPKVEQPKDTTRTEADLAALRQAGVLLPEAADSVSLDEKEVLVASELAAGKPGERGPFSDFHANVSPLLPAQEKASLALIPAVQCETVDSNGNNGDDCVGDPVTPPTPSPSPTPGQCPDKVCATACASASATATAAAFAHASARACAFAYAWACVFERMAPFNRICAWSHSEACAASFASAFGYGYATAQDQECKTVCSDGTSTTTRGPL